MKSRHHEDVSGLAADLTATVKSLGIAHNYVWHETGGKGDTLSELLRDLLAPYDIGQQHRIKVTGDDHQVGVNAATPLALVFHELATNSAKYGALSCDTGTISIDIDEDGDDLVIVWKEDGTDCGPISFEEKEGFGSRLLRISVEGQLQGSFERTFREEGLCVAFRFQKERLTATG